MGIIKEDYMKIFIPYNGLMAQDITATWPVLEDAQAFYHEKQPSLVIVEAPDYVFPNWRFDITGEGDDRFIMPDIPEGWVYDEETGSVTPGEDWVSPDPPYIPGGYSQEEYGAFLDGLLSGIRGD